MNQQGETTITNQALDVNQKEEARKVRGRTRAKELYWADPEEGRRKSREAARRRRMLNPERERERVRRWRKANPEAARETARRTRIKNATKVAARKKRWYEANKTRVLAESRERHLTQWRAVENNRLKRLYGISLEVYEQMLDRQGRVCALCYGGSSRRRGGFEVDHDHRTGKVRGLLCRTCNVGLGHFKDDPVLMERAAAYVRVAYEPIRR